MKKVLLASTIAIVLTGSIASSSAFANQTELKSEAEVKSQETKNEAIGFGSGLIAGAAVGGPLGAAIGGIFGLVVADGINSENELDQKEQVIARIENDLSDKEAEIAMLSEDYEALRNEQMTQLVSFEKEANDAWLNDFEHFETNLQFKTASSNVEKEYINQLDSISALLNRYPQLNVKLTGYADHRGDSAYNYELSEQRATAVKDYLLDSGVELGQITLIAEGESESAKLIDENVPKVSLEELYFERRVNVQLFNAAGQLTASN